MQQIVNEIIIGLQEFVLNAPFILSIFLGVLIIILESIIPVLPLGVFIALNMILFGNEVGFILSWGATCIGCFISFFFVRKVFHQKFYDKYKDNKYISKITSKLNKLEFTSFTLLTSLPFTPAFAINIGAALSKLSKKKFIVGILISKIFICYFWGFIGTTFLQSVTDIKVIIKLGIMMLIAYILSKVVMKKYKLD